MSKRATNSEVNSKIGSSLTPSAKCPTKAEIVNTGKGVVSGYSNNQLVDLASVSKKSIVVTFRADASGYYEVQIGGNITINGVRETISLNSNGTDSWSKEYTTDTVTVSGFFTAGYRESAMSSLKAGNASPASINKTLTSSESFWIKCTTGIN